MASTQRRGSPAAPWVYFRCGAICFSLETLLSSSTESKCFCVRDEPKPTGVPGRARRWEQGAGRPITGAAEKFLQPSKPPRQRNYPNQTESSRVRKDPGLKDAKRSGSQGKEDGKDPMFALGGGQFRCPAGVEPLWGGVTV